jgi:hypothetical protein
LLDIGVQWQMGVPVRGVFPVIVRAQFLNSGDKSADQMLARVVVPESLVPLMSGPRGENPTHTQLRAIDGLTLDSPDGPVQALEFSWRVQHMPPDQPETMHLTLILRNQDDYEVRLGADHPEAEAVESRFLVSPEEVRELEVDGV